jgi:hypothetical protein
MARRDDFDSTVPLPPGLDVGAIRRAVDYMERELADLVDLYFEQSACPAPALDRPSFNYQILDT